MREMYNLGAFAMLAALASTRYVDEDQPMTNQVQPEPEPEPITRQQRRALERARLKGQIR
jgi:hypothetical protein